MKRYFALGLFGIILTFIGCSRPLKEPAPSSDDFRDELVIKTTSVKNQGRSALCWIYGMLATIESDRLMLGDSVNLSVDFLARHLLQDEAHRCYFDEKKSNISLRGMCSRALALLQQYGAMPYESYHSGGEGKGQRGADYTVLARKVAQMAHGCTSLEMFDGKLNDLLDREIDFMPRVVFMLGAEYTPLEFAHSVCMPGDYACLTSFSHHPYGQRMVLESPDNVTRDSFLNVSLDTLMLHIDQTLQRGFAVCWEGDISEKGFLWDEGKAVLQNENHRVNQASRQRDYEHRKTTDDHVMEICGIARDRQGRKYYKMKNSWGTHNRYGGYIYVSENYVRQKTIAVFLRPHERQSSAGEILK